MSGKSFKDMNAAAQKQLANGKRETERKKGRRLKGVNGKETRSRRLYTLVTPSMYEELEAIADEYEISVNSLVNRFLKVGLERVKEGGTL